MLRGLEIPIEVTRLDRATDSVRRFSGQIRGVGAASESAAEKASRSWIRASERLMAANPGLSQEAARRIASQLPAETFASAREAGAASTTGTRGALLANLFGRRARLIGAGGVNQGAFLARIGASAEQISPVVGGAAAAIALFVAGIRSAVANLGQFGDALRLSGGTARDVAGIARYGFRGAEGAAAAGGFRQRIATDPMAQMFAARMGIRALPEPFGTVNNAQFLRRAVEGLRSMADAEERLRAARVLGLESALKYINVSPQMQEVLDAQADFEERIARSGAGGAANEFQVATETFAQSFRDLGASLAPIIGEAAYDIESLSDSIMRLRRGDVVGALVGTWDEGKQERHTRAVEENTKAHKDTQEAMRAFFQPGQYGGGRYSGAAMPTGWSGDFLARQMESGALSKGIPGV